MFADIIVADIDARGSSLAGEMSLLAHAPLLTLSQVYARWHTIALGTLMLWCHIELEAILWTDPLLVGNNTKLFRSALERSGNNPLSVSIRNERECIAHIPAFEPPSQHSERWKTAAFGSPFADLLPLSGLNGR